MSSLNARSVVSFDTRHRSRAVHAVLWLALGVVVGLLGVLAPAEVYGTATTGVLVAGVGWAMFRWAEGQALWWRQTVRLGLAVPLAMIVVHLVIGLVVFKGNVDFMGHFWDAERHREAILAGDLWGYRDENGGDPVILRALAGELYLGNILSGYFLGWLGLVWGVSLIGCFVFSALLSFFGTVFFVRAYELALPGSPDHRKLALCLIFLPSQAFWSSLLGKESWMYFFLGFVTYAFVRLLERISLPRVLLFVLGISGVYGIRSIIGAFIIVAAGGAILLRRPRGPLAILYPLMLVVLMAAGSAVAWKVTSAAVSGEIAADRVVSEAIAEAVVRRQAVTSDLTGADYDEAVAQAARATPETALRRLPVAIVGFLTRPWPFEVRNGLMLLASIEVTALLGMLLWARRGLWRLPWRLWRSPFTMYCAGCAVMFTAALSFSLNVGIIVRHRIMVLPFLIMLVLACSWPARAARGPEVAA